MATALVVPAHPFAPFVLVRSILVRHDRLVDRVRVDFERLHVMRILVLCLACVALNARPLFSQQRAQARAASCIPTATETRLSVVGAMAGIPPVWLVDG